MAILPCALVHHTGTIIRFRPSQLRELPASDLDLTIELPSGKLVEGHFRRHPANPNISGRGVVKYIKARLNFGDVRPGLIDNAGKTLWRLYKTDRLVQLAQVHRISQTRASRGSLTGRDIKKLLAAVDRVQSATQRRREYAKLLRPAALRRIVLDLMGARCQVDGCTAHLDMRRQWRDPAAAVAILDVHHIEALARCIDHNPRNLCILCGNHHHLIHYFGPWEVSHAGDDVILTKGSRDLRIVRDLGFMRE